MEKVSVAAEVLLKSSLESDRTILNDWKESGFDKDTLKVMVKLHLEYGRLRVERVSGLIDLHCTTFRVTRAELAAEYAAKIGSSDQSAAGR